MKLPKTIHAVDLFCGAGGTSQGLARACKETAVEVDLVAINHWETAVNTHARNHPWARHFLAPVETVNPREAFPGGVVHILCASPECTHHSTARGGKPTNDQLRASAWHIMRWINELDIRNILIENVPEFESWGPVSQKTGRPIKAQRGRYFRAFVEALSACGYAVQWRVLNAADYGDATSRRRLFLMARKGRRAPEWPAPTHSKTGADGEPSTPGTLPWRSARSIIDWSLQGQSIFDRERRGLKPLARRTVERIIKGLERYGGEDLQPFLVLLRGKTIHPWQFGHGEKKETWLWLRGLPPLEPTDVVEGREPRVHWMGRKDRQKNRSRTYLGIAAAMAEQWGGLSTVDDGRGS